MEKESLAGEGYQLIIPSAPLGNFTEPVISLAVDTIVNGSRVAPAYHPDVDVTAE